METNLDWLKAGEEGYRPSMGKGSKHIQRPSTGRPGRTKEVKQHKDRRRHRVGG